VNENIGPTSSPGQPLGARDLFQGTNALSTTCAANVATTRGLTLDPDATYADRVLLAIGGKPRDRKTFIIGTTPTPGDYFIRFKSPTYAFNPANGSKLTDRRDAVDTAKCLRCHRGTLYQHGGDRVDNEQLCVICHNPSAGERNVRESTFRILKADNTVDTSKTYDGKTNETYDLRYMLHAIHGVSKRGVPLVIYRSRGIYAFVPPVYETVFDATEGSSGANVEVETAFPFPTGWPTPPDNTVFGSLRPAPPQPQGTQTNATPHNWTVVHYPKPPNECTACHVAGQYFEADQTKAVALTIDPGANYQDQRDDLVIGPTAGACTACHFTASTRSHADQFGYSANVTKDDMLVLAQP
jgi:hypothetical protein